MNGDDELDLNDAPDEGDDPQARDLNQALTDLQELNAATVPFSFVPNSREYEYS